MGFQDSSSLETALLPAWLRAERQCARRARRKVAAQGGDSRPQATSRVRAAESPRLASPSASAPELLLRGLGSSGPPALRPPSPRQRPPHLQPEGGPGPSRSTKATLKVFSNQRRLRLRDLAPRRACAPVAPQRERARRRAQTRRAGGRGRAPLPTVRLRARLRKRPSGRVAGAGGGNGRRAWRTLAGPGGAVLARTRRSHGYWALKGRGQSASRESGRAVQTRAAS